MIKILISLLLLFNQVQLTEKSTDQVCHTVIYCECIPSKGGDTCTMKVVTECES